MSKRKNLIILCPDEMRGDCLGANGLNADIKTPCMDRLAQRGMNLTRHFTTAAKCVPSRISLMTGRYLHTDGYRTIFQHLPKTSPDLLTNLLGHGYQTVLFGKNHCWEHALEATHTPPELAPGTDGHRLTAHSWIEPYRTIYEKHKAGQPQREKPSLVRNAYHNWADESHTEEAIAFLTQHRDRTTPFFLQVNLGAPHPPYVVEDPYFLMYDRQKMTAFPHDLPRNAPEALLRQREVRLGHDVSDAALREVQAVYYGMISKVDQQIGRIVAAIDAENLWEDTTVLFWSDHGDFAGQYGCWEKWDTVFSDCLLNVPCMLWDPDLPGGTRYDGLTNTCDLAPTLAALLGVGAVPEAHGIDLTDFLRSGHPAREAVFASGGHEPEMRARVETLPVMTDKQETYGRYPETLARAQMVRTTGAKLVYRESGDHELYDLQSDPWELDNRWHDASLDAVRSALMELLLGHSLRTWTERPYQQRVVA